MSTADEPEQSPEIVPDDWTAPTEPALPAVRPGPALLDADSWEERGGPEPSVETYEGRRRAASPALRMWLVLGLVLLGLCAVIAIPLALVAGRAGPDSAAATTTRGEPTGDETQSNAVARLVPATGAAARPTTTAAKPTTTSQRPATTTTRTSAAGFSVTLEAEAPSVVLSGSARVDTYPGASNGSIVRNVGKWDANPGSLRFTVALPSAGSYVITIWYVHLDGEAIRSAQIAVSGADTVTRSFNGSSTCCASLALNPIALAAGTHTVTIGNPTSHAPSIDKIVIARA